MPVRWGSFCESEPSSSGRVQPGTDQGRRAHPKPLPLRAHSPEIPELESCTSPWTYGTETRQNAATRSVCTKRLSRTRAGSWEKKQHPTGRGPVVLSLALTRVLLFQGHVRHWRHEGVTVDTRAAEHSARWERGRTHRQHPLLALPPLLYPMIPHFSTLHFLWLFLRSFFSQPCCAQAVLSLLHGLSSSLPKMSLMAGTRPVMAAHQPGTDWLQGTWVHGTGPRGRPAGEWNARSHQALMMCSTYIWDSLKNSISTDHLGCFFVSLLLGSKFHFFPPFFSTPEQKGSTVSFGGFNWRLYFYGNISEIHVLVKC